MKIGDIFESAEGIFPQEALDLCVDGISIQEVEPNAEGVRCFQVVVPPEPTKEELEAQALAQAKEERADAVAKIVVEVDGMLFDGDETSQGRMARSAVAMTSKDTITWVLHDNTIAQVTKAQLVQALRLSGEEQTRLWTIPYEA